MILRTPFEIEQAFKQIHGRVERFAQGPKKLSKASKKTFVERNMADFEATLRGKGFKDSFEDKRLVDLEQQTALGKEWHAIRPSTGVIASAIYVQHPSIESVSIHRSYGTPYLTKVNFNSNTGLARCDMKALKKEWEEKGVIIGRLGAVFLRRDKTPRRRFMTIDKRTNSIRIDRTDLMRFAIELASRIR